MNYISSSDPEAFITVYKVSGYPVPAEEDQFVIESALFLALDTSIVLLLPLSFLPQCLKEILQHL